MFKIIIDIINMFFTNFNDFRNELSKFKGFLKCLF